MRTKANTEAIRFNTDRKKQPGLMEENRVSTPFSQNEPSLGKSNKQRLTEGVNFIESDDEEVAIGKYANTMAIRNFSKFQILDSLANHSPLAKHK